MRKMLLSICFLFFFFFIGEKGMAQADPATYLTDVKAELNRNGPTTALSI